MNELRHYGIKGQKWGVRRFENIDGTLTPEGKKRYSALRTRNDVEKIFSSFSKKDKRLLGAGENDSEYMSKEAHAYWVSKRFIAREGKTPVAFFDIIKDSNGEANIAIGTNSRYRGKGYASKIASKGAKWIASHPEAFTKVNWGAFDENEASIVLAKKNGFELEKSQNGFSIYSRKG